MFLLMIYYYMHLMCIIDVLVIMTYDWICLFHLFHLLRIVIYCLFYIYIF